jgi:hypothetical protein
MVGRLADLLPSPRLARLPIFGYYKRWGFIPYSSRAADHKTKSRLDGHTVSVARKPPAPRLHAK